MYPFSARILIVDDSDAIRILAKAILAKMGFKNVLEAENGKVALNRIRQVQLEQHEQIDLVLSDWNMPEMNGMHLLLEMKADAQLRSIPVLIITAERDMKQAIRAISAGASDYIVKPFDESSILSKFEAVWKMTQIRKSSP